MKSLNLSLASVNSLQVLPAYADFLLTQKLDAYCRKQLEWAYELNIPLLKFFERLTSEERFAITCDSAIEFLTYVSQNKGAEQIEEAQQRWKTNHLPLIDRDAVVAEDITLGNYLRKKLLVHFISDYTTDATTILALIDEIDLFLTAALTAATNTYMDLLKERIEEHSHFIQKVAETIPGAVYVFDREAYKGIYANKKLPDIIGLDQEELNRMGSNAIGELIHPDDREGLRKHLDAMGTAKDGETLVYKYRVKDNHDGYKWLANYESVFKRKENGSVWQTIGITLDINHEQKIVGENQNLVKSLSRSEALYKKAEEIANMGNWVWYVKKNKLEWTDQLYRIYGLEPQQESITIDRFLSFIHPDDREFVQNGVQALSTEDNLDYTFRIINPDGNEKWLRSLAHVIRDKAGNISTIIGIEQDVTEKQRLIKKLEESQRLYKQAQDLAKMGNFSWDVHTNTVFWSDEVYAIYERPLGSEVRFDDSFLPIIEEHKPKVQDAIAQLLSSKVSRSVSYAIRRRDGGLKYIILHTDVQLNKHGEVGCVVGTVQDITEKEELIEQLKQSELLYKQAQALSHLGNWTLDMQTNKITWSDELFAIYERQPTEPPTIEEWHSYIHPDDREMVLSQFDFVLNNKKPLDIIHRIVLRDGKVKVLHRRGELSFTPDGKPHVLIGTTQEITERYKVETELKESQTFIRKITDATPSIIATYNVRSGRYTFISQGVEKLLGYSAGEALEKGVSFFMDLVHPDDLQQLLEQNAKAMERANEKESADTIVEFTYRLKHQNGSWRWLHTYGTPFDYDSKGRVKHVLNISLDVTAQMEASKTIREQEHFIQQIADASPTILYLFDVPTQRFAYINREAFFVLGYLPDEIMEAGAGATDFLYHPEDIPLLPNRRQSKKTFQQVDSMIQYECRMRDKEGTYCWLLIREIVFKSDDAGNISQILGAALDINRRKEMERTILQNTLQLEQSNASLEEFAYVASHDLKEPLRKISTFGDRLVASQIDRLSDDGKIYLRKIVDASQRMQNMISDLLSISMISGNRAFELSSLQKILEETIQTLEFKIESQGAVVRYDQLPEAKIVPAQFRQLFQNLLSNSLKFVRPDVQPVITISCADADTYEVAPYQLAKAERYIKLTFADNGIGFENEYAQKIFAIFQRLHGRSEYEGSGIGLSICKKIVEHHGGVIFAQGKAGEGARFTIILPA